MGKAPESNVTRKAGPSSRPRGRPKGGGDGLDVAVATRIRPEEATALDKAVVDLGFKSRAELLRYWIRAAVGV